MTNNIYLISPSFLKSNTPIDGNVDDSLILPYIIVSQNIDLQTALGSNFYNEILLQGSTGTLTPVNQAFKDDYIKPFLVQKTFYYVIPAINFKLTDLGILKIGNDNSDNVDLKELQWFRQSVLDLSEYYLARIQKELKDNAELYPTYNNDKLQNQIPNKSSYFSGLYIPPTEGESC